MTHGLENAYYPRENWSLISDTVGFIQGLPHDLIYAFRSTLEESLDADALIHVVDISSPIWAEQVQTVEQVLKDLGAGEVPTIYAFNKCDKVRDVNVAEIAAGIQGNSPLQRSTATG